MGSEGLSQTNNSGESCIVHDDGKSIPLNQLEDWQIDALKMREESPVEDKVGLVLKFLYDRWIKYPADVFERMALIDGMQPEYAQIYGDFASGMVVESVATVVITGLKSASGLSKGFTSEGDVIAGSGIGNVNKGGSKTDVVEVEISRSKYPESAKHIEDAIANGQPNILTINRGGAKPNRKASLKGIDKVPGKDLDEYPPAMFKEGGEGASIRPINPSDNRGSGSTSGHQLRPYPELR